MKNILLSKVISYILIAILLFILLFNIVFYDPIFGYDAEAHYAYVDYVAMYLPDNFELPSDKDSREFFNPPIAYLFPSFVATVCRNTISAENIVKSCQPIYGKATQIFQSILFLITLFFYSKTLKLFTFKKSNLLLNFLILILLLTVNYRTLSMIRGEPYVLLFMSMVLYYYTKLLLPDRFRYSKRDVLTIGFLIGLLALSRQWAFLLFPGFFFMYLNFKKDEKSSYLKFLISVFSIGFLVSSWFYFSLFFEYGSFTAFNKDPSSFSFSNQDLYFYIPISPEIKYIFTKPIRPFFSNQFLPILYSDLWGDYWGYFSFTSRNLSAGLNQMMIGDYLARVNIFALLPSFILLGSLKTTKDFDESREYKIFLKFITYLISVSFFGYLWFAIKYPALPTGDTIKASYIIQLFHLLCFPAAFRLDHIYRKNVTFYYIIIFLLLIVFGHNLSAMLSHFRF